MLKTMTLIIGLIGLSLAGCAMAQGSMPAATADTNKGKALVDASSMTLYAFDKDSVGKSACNGPCAQNWPAFKATDAAAPAGWSKIKRDDGTMQWAYKDRPRDRRKIGGRNIVGLDPIGSEAGAGRCPTRNSPRLRHAPRRPAPDNVTPPNLAAVPAVTGGKPIT